VWDLIKRCARFSSPFQLNHKTWNSAIKFDLVTWTIPFEFAGSLLVFAILLATSRVSDYRKRTILILGIALWACVEARWVFFLFASGVG
jgi:peptidoglycan/LPS O-acetylase OafA/YrhL